ncbi:STAS domain-containing protein [Streptomyces sp. NPDC050439]|uniref:STAS domain-containing protein n=1 Tax=unclassified Streptomyces TaxID=2593676 RepID=UPI00343F99E7
MPRFRRRRRSRPRPWRAHEVVRLRGEIDDRSVTATGRRLLDALSAGPEVLEVDLTQVTYLSPAGTAPLFTALRAARSRGSRLVITHAGGRVEATLREVGLYRALRDPDADG